jgi:hypothetical protein
MLKFQKSYSSDWANVPALFVLNDDPELLAISTLSGSPCSPWHYVLYYGTAIEHVVVFVHGNVDRLPFWNRTHTWVLLVIQASILRSAEEGINRNSVPC